MENRTGRLSYDVLIMGSGIAGLCAAITAAEKGMRVAVISKADSLEDTNTNRAQGGIVGHGEQDRPDLLAQDIATAGDGLSSAEAVRLVARDGPDLVDRFLVDKIGVPFSKLPNGSFDRTLEAAHSVRRIYHAMDGTGAAIQNALLRHTADLKNIDLFKDHIAVDLMTNTHNSSDPQQRYRPGRVLGAYVLDGKTGRVSLFFSGTVILATGGVGNLFLHTSNPMRATGDGIAMAHRIGAEITNAEYVQFHPTVLYHRDLKRFLISEALRGEGARLVNLRGEHFMERYEPNAKDLASRDRVTRAIYREMEAENSEHVHLDASEVRGVSLENRFPSIFRTCLDLGVDIRREPIPVVPAAHYFCGGIKVDLDGRTSIPGLWAVGECSCTGVHGANPLASVSLLEGLLWGVRAGGALEARDTPAQALRDSVPDWVYPLQEEVFDPLLVKQDFRTIQSTMWYYAGVIRTHKRLQRAIADLDYLSHRIEQFYREAKLTRGIIELRDSVLVARLIVQAAAGNPVSKGCHWIE